MRRQRYTQPARMPKMRKASGSRGTGRVRRTIPCRPDVRVAVGRVTAMLCCGMLLAASCARATEPPHGVSNPDGRRLASFSATGRVAMVASASVQASEIGREVLRGGGNAVDAAVAVSFAVSVIRPQSTGIGGGGFMLAHLADTGQTEIYDFRETAPAGASRDMYLREGKVVPGLSLVGHQAVAVPGTVAGLWAAHQDHGSVPWAQLVAPAIELAAKGFPVYPELARRLHARRDALAENDAARNIFFRDRRPLRAGEVLVQADLAGTLRRIATDGRRGFYSGPVAEAMAADMAVHGGRMTDGDLEHYRVVRREPVRGTYRGYEVVSMPPPSSGGAHLIQMLNVLEGYDLPELGARSPDVVHLMIESMRQAYADRAYFMGDPAFVDIPLARLTSKAYAEQTRQHIRTDRARNSDDVRPGLAAPRESDSTTHLSIVDPAGNAVSSTQTINYSFGACVVAAGTGILLNDEMDDFAAAPGVPNVYGLVGGDANAIAPGKRPLSSMTPTLVLNDGKPVLVLGSPGGSRIITSVLQTLVNLIDFDLPLSEAVAAGRFHHQWLPDRVDLETVTLPESATHDLRQRGHILSITDSPLGEIQAVRILPDGTRIGMSDPRRSGGAAGY